MLLALHYWVKWNLLADRWATHTFAVETLTAAEIMQRWCTHCATARTCACPPSAELALAQNRTTQQRERVKARRGHGKRKGTPLTWAALTSVDVNMTRVARLLTQEYGYPLELEELELKAQAKASGFPAQRK